jgi:hypothetical protein
VQYRQFLKIVEDASKIEQYKEGFDLRKDVLIEKWSAGGKYNGP